MQVDRKNSKVAVFNNEGTLFLLTQALKTIHKLNIGKKSLVDMKAEGGNVYMCFEDGSVLMTDEQLLS